jgi:peptide deformylase
MTTVIPDLTKTVPVIQTDLFEKELRTPSLDVPIDQIKTKEFQDFIDLLYNSMFTVKLPEGWMHAGISAVQINRHLNVFWAYNNNLEDYEVFINPRVELLGTSTDLKDESCLSIPDTIGKVRRHKRVRVTYLDRDGNEHRRKLSGWDARVVQHEYDHLRGDLFIDKIEA